MDKRAAGGLPEPLAVVDGVRTPFAKAFTALSAVSAENLGRLAVQGALQRSRITPEQVDEVVLGNVAGPADASNVSRVIALRAGVPADRIAHTINRNCASGMDAIVAGWQAVRDGRSQIVVVGGTESMSNIPLLWDRRVAELLVSMSRQRSWWGKLKTAARFRPSMLKPVVALEQGLTDPTCGLIMGKTAEVLARDFLISREEQDRFALRSHQRAVAAQERCFFQDEIVPVRAELAGGETVAADVGPRSEQSLEALGRLKPYFEPDDGTVTVGNSCGVTDGAAALVVMPAGRASADGYEPLGYIRAYSFAGCDPRRMGLGPVFATAKVLEQTGLSLADFELIELNEAFAAQVLACLKAVQSREFARTELGRDEPLGDIDPERLNVNGGAVALGHPVGTSGARIVLTLLRALREKGLRRGLATMCVGGGQGGAIVVETSLD